MKKLYISADIEGTCGIADWKETELTEAQGGYFRAQMTAEVKAACDAACENGVQDIFVKDAHDTGRNLDPSKLPESVRILRAWTRDPYFMMSGLDASYDAAMFIGYHSGAGSNGNPLAHTMNTANVRVLVNGIAASECLLNTYTAASFEVPVVLVCGDRQLCESVKALNPNIRTVAVSEGIGAASLSIHPALAVSRIKAAAAEAILADPAACSIQLPPRFELAVQFKLHDSAYRGSFYPGAVQTGPYEVSYACTEWLEALKFLFFIL